MHKDPSPFPLPDDAQRAKALDIAHFLGRDNTPPSIAQAAEGDDLWSGVVRSMCAIVGSAAALEDLHAEPDLDESFDWTDITGQDQATVSELLNLIERPGPEGAGSGDTIWEILDIADAGMPWIDDEYRTIICRILRLLAIHPDRPLDRRVKPNRLAAAVVWVALDASGAFMTRRRRWKNRDLWDWFGVSSCVKIGRALAENLVEQHLSAVQLDERSPHSRHAERVLLGDGALLHSRYRSLLVDERNQLIERISEQHVRARQSQPVQSPDGNLIHFRSRPATVRWAAKGATEQGRSSILVALGDDLDDLELLALSVTDARRLLAVVEQALNEPLAATS